MSSGLEKDKNISSASEQFLGALGNWMHNCRLHPDEIAQEISYLFAGMYNRAEEMANSVKKIKGTKPTKK
jgi:hypothetical protein